ncbi:MAG: AmmeMemoRadiSam system protein A [Gammaproteobacteria bacterium]
MDRSCCIELAAGDKNQLLRIARQSIDHGFAERQPIQLDVTTITGSLALDLGVFVTITQRGALRGCVGSLEPRHPLAQGVAVAAFNAAFHDRRFPALSRPEAELVRIEISVLSALESIPMRSNQELLDNLTPHVDGLLIEDDDVRATFLPKVWDKLADPASFVAQLKEKAGLDTNHWSETIRCYRYQSHTFSEQETGATTG